ncbi:outer membrane protein [Blastomonas sp. SL216]|uniref:outer membrane protein n=1 Tax=Blastomonas sp. SL216 TaxID=2995169 RepID=UPI00237763CE|nr:outer membrane beta-barrel protein [Blastomonas sp. SL216]
MKTPIKFSAVSAIAIAMLATPAFAQTVKEDTDFDGVYVGGHFGYSAQSSPRGEGVTFDTNVDGDFNDTVRTAAGANAFAPGFCRGSARTAIAGDGCRQDQNDIEYGIRIGADKRYGNFVIGALVEGSRSEAKDSVTAFSSTPANYVFTRELDYAVSARARAGYTPGGGILFYGTGGASYGRIDNSFRTTNGANAFTPRNGKDWSWGWQAGGGVEAKIAPNMSIGLEYLYNTYTNDDYVVNVGPGTATATNPFLLRAGQTDMRRSDPNFEFHSIRVTTAFRF